MRTCTCAEASSSGGPWATNTIQFLSNTLKRDKPSRVMLVPHARERVTSTNMVNQDSRYDALADARFRRNDDSLLLSYQARMAFVESIRHGAAHTDLAEAALAIAAEDDALGAPAFGSTSNIPYLLSLLAGCGM
jgi:hypothetical protein